jgi:hypothetical protein
MSLLDIAASPLFSGIAGGLAGLLTGVLNFFQKREDNKFALLKLDKDLELLKVQANVDQAKYAALLEFQRQKGADDAFTASQASEARPSQGGRKIAALRESVRPVLTYWYQVASICILAAAITAWWQQWCAAEDVVPLIQYIVISIVNLGTMSGTWYFGQRQIDRVSVSWGNKVAGAGVKVVTPPAALK